MLQVKLFHPPLYLSLLFFSLSLAAYSVLVHHFALLWNKQDLQTYYIAAQDVLANRNIYLSGHTYFNFLYTPFTALLFTPFALLPIAVFKWSIAILSIFSLLLSCWLTLTFLGYKQRKMLLSATLFLSGFLLWLEPVQQTLEYGQINLILMTLILIGFRLREKPYLSGLSIGLAAAIKLTPAIFIAYLFLTRQTRAGMIALTTVVVTILIGFFILPASSQHYWHGLFLDTSRIGDAKLIGDQSLNALLSRMFGNEISAKPYWYILGVIFGIGGLYLAKRAYAKRHELLGILFCAFTGLLISPFSWSHHWVWIVPLLIYCFQLTYAKQYYYGWLALLALFTLFGWLTPLIPNLSSMHHIITFTTPKLRLFYLQENAYVFFGIFFLIISGVCIFRRK